ncbi:MAG: HAMP domain-containing protein [Caldilineaceae bacterium]|nr:HAMP domain-containing protein [Caldilineaceae bacterium]
MEAIIRRTPLRMKWQPWSERFWKLLGGVNIRTKILGIVLALTLVLGVGVTFQVRSVMERVFIEELENRGRSVVSDLAARSVDPILLNDTYTLYELLRGTLENHPDLLYAFVVDPNAHVLAHTFGEAGFPTALLDVNQMAAPGEISHFVYRSDDGQIHDFAMSLFEGRSGFVRIGLTENRLHTIVNTVTSQMLLTTVVVAIGGILAASLLTWLLTRPILALVATTQRVGQGDLQTRAPHWADDEIGTLADAFNQMVVDLSTSRQALAEKDAARGRLLEQLITAQEEERKRIARELHDGIGQALTSLIVGLKLTLQITEPEQVKAKNDELRQHAIQMLSEVRLISRQLRPSVLDDLGLTEALERYADEFTRLYSSMTVDFHSELSQRLSPSAETTLYRIVQEAMTNAARHSGGDVVSVLLQQRQDHVLAIIEDNGTGFDPEAARRAGQSVGIHGMAERAELLGGQLMIESSTDGTSIYLEIPT